MFGSDNIPMPNPTVIARFLRDGKMRIDHCFS